MRDQYRRRRLRLGMEPMYKIANTAELQTELRRLLAYAQSQLPSRQKLARELLQLSDRVAATDRQVKYIETLTQGWTLQDWAKIGYPRVPDYYSMRPGYAIELITRIKRLGDRPGKGYDLASPAQIRFIKLMLKDLQHPQEWVDLGLDEVTGIPLKGLAGDQLTGLDRATAKEMIDILKARRSRDPNRILNRLYSPFE